jgi:hypothetical protein
LVLIESDEFRAQELEKALLHLDLPQHEIIASLMLFSGSENFSFVGLLHFKNKLFRFFSILIEPHSHSATK